MSDKQLARKIVDAIWDDIYGRSGGDHFLEAAGDEEISVTMESVRYA